MLSTLSLLYLGIPWFLFFAGWLRLPYALLLIAVLALSLGNAVRILIREEPRAHDLLPQSLTDALLALGVTLFLLYLSGVGGLGHQQPDWRKHDAVLTALVERPWPVRFAGSGDTGDYLAYYLAYYLPAALVGRWLGLYAAHLALFLWTLAGLWLAGQWVMRLTGSKSWIVWAAWFALSGMGVIGVIAHGGVSQLGLGPGWERWAVIGGYPSSVSMLVWVPQHIVGAWLAAAMIVSRAEERGDSSLVPLCVGLTAIWSPFVTLGLVPVAIVVLIRTGWKKALLPVNLIGPVIIALVAVIFLRSVDSSTIPRGLNFRIYPWALWLKKFVLILVLEFGVYAALTWALLAKPRDALRARLTWSRAWLALAVVIFSLLPLYKFGFYNDLMMRASIPAQFVFWIVILRVFAAEIPGGLRWQASVLLACLLIGALQPIHQLGDQVRLSHRGFNFPQERIRWSIDELEPNIRSQYVGRNSSFFFRHLVRVN